MGHMYPDLTYLMTYVTPSHFNENNSLIIINCSSISKLPRTICFGRGSTKVFQRNFPKKSKKKTKDKSDNEKHTSQEVTSITKILFTIRLLIHSSAASTSCCLECCCFVLTTS